MDTDLARLQEQRSLFENATRAPRTVHAYAGHWRHFTAWCDRAGLATLPCSSDTLSLYACAMIGSELCLSTVEARITAVSQQHKRGGHPSPLSPLVRGVITGARRILKRPEKAMAAITVEQLRLIYRSLDASHKVSAARNRAILSLGWACAMRQSEICQLDLADLLFETQGLRVTLRWSKTDQEGQGRDIGIFPGNCAETCPITLLRDWLHVRGSFPGPLFPRIKTGGNVTATRMHGGSICLMVKTCVARIGLNRSQYGGHSLRAGFITAAIQAGVSVPAIMIRTGHKSVATVERYVRPASAFASNPLAAVL